MEEEDEKIENKEVEGIISESDLLDIYDIQYNDLFPKIIKYNEEKFFARLQEQVLLSLRVINKLSDLSLMSYFQELIYERYKSDKQKIEDDFEKVKKLPENEIKYLDYSNCYIHCHKDLEAFHTCLNKLILYDGFVYCLHCNKVYNENQIKLYCCECDEIYYSLLRKNVIESNAYFFPVAFVKNHCQMENEEEEIIKCLQCGEELYYDLSKLKDENYEPPDVITQLVCPNCKLMFDTQEVKFICYDCEKEFMTDAKLYNDFSLYRRKILFLVHSLFKEKNALPDNYNGKKCICNTDLIKQYLHEKDKGVLLEGYKDEKNKIICQQCFEIFDKDSFEWKCPLCRGKFKIVKPKEDENNKNKKKRKKKNIKEENKKENENKNEIIDNNNEIKDDKNEIKDYKNEIKDNKNEIKDDKNEIIDNNNEIKDDKNEIKDNKNEIIDNKNEIKENNKEEIKDNNKNEIIDNKNEIKDNNSLKDNKILEYKDNKNEIKDNKIIENNYNNLNKDENKKEIKDNNKNEIKDKNNSFKNDNLNFKNEQKIDKNEIKNEIKNDIINDIKNENIKDKKNELDEAKNNNKKEEISHHQLLDYKEILKNIKIDEEKKDDNNLKNEESKKNNKNNNDINNHQIDIKNQNNINNNLNNNKYIDQNNKINNNNNINNINNNNYINYNQKEAQNYNNRYNINEIRNNDVKNDLEKEIDFYKNSFTRALAEARKLLNTNNIILSNKTNLDIHKRSNYINNINNLDNNKNKNIYNARKNHHQLVSINESVEKSNQNININNKLNEKDIKNKEKMENIDNNKDNKINKENIEKESKKNKEEFNNIKKYFKDFNAELEKDMEKKERQKKLNKEKKEKEFSSNQNLGIQTNVNIEKIREKYNINNVHNINNKYNVRNNHNIHNIYHTSTKDVIDIKNKLNQYTDNKKPEQITNINDKKIINSNLSNNKISKKTEVSQISVKRRNTKKNNEINDKIKNNLLVQINDKKDKNDNNNIIKNEQEQPKKEIIKYDNYKRDINNNKEEKQQPKNEIKPEISNKNDIKTEINNQSEKNDEINNKNEIKPESEISNDIKPYAQITINSNNYKNIRVLGQGSYGKIYLVEDTKTKEQYAMKKLILGDQLELRDNQDEFNMIMQITSTYPELNIIHVIGTETKNFDDYNYVFYVLMEVANCDWEKELFNRSKYKAYYTEDEMFYILQNLVDTFAYLQQIGICHRDIKPQNILCFGEKGYKISDFGEAKYRKKWRLKQSVVNYTSMQTVRGTELYMSPILYTALKTGPNQGANHNVFKSDVFSLGMCFLFASCLDYKCLYEVRKANNNTMKLKKIIEQCINGRYSDKFKDILTKMLEINEKERPDFIELSSIV